MPYQGYEVFPVATQINLVELNKKIKCTLTWWKGCKSEYKYCYGLIVLGRF